MSVFCFFFFCVSLVVVSQAREDRHAENRHGHNLEADKNQLIIGLGLTDCPKQEKLEKVSSMHSSS